MAKFDGEKECFVNEEDFNSEGIEMSKQKIVFARLKKDMMLNRTYDNSWIMIIAPAFKGQIIGEDEGYVLLSGHGISIKVPEDEIEIVETREI